MVMFDDMTCDCFETASIVKIYADCVPVMSINYNDRKLMPSGPGYDTSCDGMTLYSFIHQNNGINHVIGNDVKNCPLGSKLVLSPVQIRIQSEYEQRTVGFVQFVVKCFDKAEKVGIIYSRGT